MTARTQLWIMVDLETTGPIYGTHSLTEIGAVVGSVEKGIVDRFEAIVRPIGDAVAASPESYERAKREGIDPKDAMGKFAAWAAPHLAAKARFVARPAAFDWPWIVYYAWRFLGANPFGFKAVCASSWFESRGKVFKVEIPHIAVRDAEIQLEHFLTEA